MARDGCRQRGKEIRLGRFANRSKPRGQALCSEINNMERTSYSRKPTRARSSHIASCGQILGIILREKQGKSGVRKEIGENCLRHWCRPDLAVHQSRFGLVVIRLRALWSSEVRVWVVEMMRRGAVRRWFGVDVGAVVTWGHHTRVRGRLPSDTTQVGAAVATTALSRILVRWRLHYRRWAVPAGMRGQGRSMMIRTERRD